MKKRFIVEMIYDYGKFKFNLKADSIKEAQNQAFESMKEICLTMDYNTEMPKEISITEV